jgi:uncharacterized protein affecting Mg2+/Co2+ transport
VFTYRITIENQSEYTTQLLRRHWHIHDAGFAKREVEGEGVVGLRFTDLVARWSATCVHLRS